MFISSAPGRSHSYASAKSLKGQHLPQEASRNGQGTLPRPPRCLVNVENPLCVRAGPHVDRRARPRALHLCGSHQHEEEHVGTTLSCFPSSASLTVSSPVHTFSPKLPPLKGFPMCGRTHFSFFHHATYSSQHLAEEKKKDATDLTLRSKSLETFSLWFPLWLFLSMPSFSIIHSFVLSVSTMGGPTLGCKSPCSKQAHQ